MQQLAAFLNQAWLQVSALQKFLEPYAQTIFHHLHTIEPFLAGVLLVLGIVGRCMSVPALVLALCVIGNYFSHR